MDHVSILKKSLKLLPKIISGEKSIESRWYVSRFAPWDKIAAGDIVYFKNSGEDITAKAEVTKVMQFSDLNEVKIRKILCEYGHKIGLNAAEQESWVLYLTKTKHYCVLIFLANPKIINPFKISKAGFGASCAWMCVGNISDKIKRS